MVGWLKIKTSIYFEDVSIGQNWRIFYEATKYYEVFPHSVICGRYLTYDIYTVTSGHFNWKVLMKLIRCIKGL